MKVAEAATPDLAGSPGEERFLSRLIERRIEGRETLAEAVLLAAAAIVAWWFRFVQDDAFITYRYSRNLARGEGLVFNPGERVEGYTNFLWTLIHVIPEKLGWSSPAFSQVLGVVLMVATVMVVLRVARELFGSAGFAWLVGAVLVANMTFLGYATGGLETMQQTLFLMLAVWAVLPALRTGASLSVSRLLGAGVVAGVAVLTRLDSVVFLAALLVAVLVRQWKESGRNIGEPLRTLAVAAVPLVVVVAPWLVWKLSYYGELLPNTFHAKASSGPLPPIIYGLIYVTCYFLSFGAFLLIGRFRKYRRELFSIPGMAALLAAVPVWLAYVIYVGADFMEYRFFVVITPLLAMLAAFLIDRFSKPLPQILLVATLLAFSAGHAVLLNPLPIPVLSFKMINHWPSASDTTWFALGNTLAEEFPGGAGVEGQPVLAVAPLGVIGYYSDLETVDMLGLTDAYVAREGDEAAMYYPGHVRMAPVDYLLQRGVDLVVGQPAILDSSEERSEYRLSELVGVYPVADLNELPEDAVVIELPANDRYFWPVIYFGGNEKVDEAIERNGWSVKPIDRVCDPADLDNFLIRIVAGSTCPDA